MLSPEAYSPWKPYNAGCRVYIIYPHLMPGYIIYHKTTKKCTHLYHRQLQIKSSFFVPLLSYPWAASLTNHVCRWSWCAVFVARHPAPNLWNLCCDCYCHRSAVLQHHHSFTHNCAPHTRICLHWETQTFKVKRQLSSNLTNSHDNFVLIKQQIENLFWRKNKFAKRRGIIICKEDVIKSCTQQLYLKLLKPPWEFPRQIYCVFFLPQNQ